MTSDTTYDGEPILQLLAFKRIVGENGARYRLLLSDGQYLNSFSVLATNLNHLIEDSKLIENAIFKITKHVTAIVYRNGYTDAGFVVCTSTFRMR